MWSRPRKPQRNPKPSATRRLGLVHERRVVELQLLERVAQQRVLVRLRSGRARRRPSAWPGGSRAAASAAGVRSSRDRVADAALRDVLEARRDVADLAALERRQRPIVRGRKTPTSSGSTATARLPCRRSVWPASAAARRRRARRRSRPCRRRTCESKTSARSGASRVAASAAGCARRSPRGSRATPMPSLAEAQDHLRPRKPITSLELLRPRAPARRWAGRSC